MRNFLFVLVLTFFQNASFTLVSRARNSSSVSYHASAAILSNFIYLLVFRKLSMSVDDPLVMVAYMIGAVSGSVGMHIFAMKKFERTNG